MGNKDREIVRAPKYAPPYPQSFHPFWPKHALTAGLLLLIVLLVPLVLAYYLQVPMDSNMPPLPDEGANIPAPEWYLFFIFQPFWYLTGEAAKWLSIGTFWLPSLVLVFLLSVPLIFKRRKASPAKMATSSKIVSALILCAFWIGALAGVVKAGHPAKTTGCTSCHNPMMGVRQALPPASMTEFYKTERARQIAVGRYRIGDANHIGASYKDANWQLRHFYEPTMTW